jgi:ABC-type uncharacterized transport system involved in gliding motility auxiliary subunit
VGGATQPLDPAALGRLRDFVAGGGATLMLMEPIVLNAQSPMPMPAMSGLEPLVQERGITIGPGLVADMASSERVSLGQRGLFNVISPYPLWPIALPAGDHPTTNGLNGLTLGWASALTVGEGASGVSPLWQTTESAAIHPLNAPIVPDQDWLFAPEELGVRTIATAVLPEDGDTRGRMIVVGDVSFTEPNYMQANPGNLLFLANAIDWLAQDEALISIRSKNRTPPSLVFESDAIRNLLKWGNLVGVPLLFILIGVARVNGRRRRAELRWREVVS